MEKEIRFSLQMFLQILQHDIVDVRSEVSHGGIEEFELVLHAFFLDIRTGGGVEFGAFTSVLEVYLINVSHQVKSFIFSDMLL